SRHRDKPAAYSNDPPELWAAKQERQDKHKPASQEHIARHAERIHESARQECTRPAEQIGGHGVGRIRGRARRVRRVKAQYAKSQHQAGQQECSDNHVESPLPPAVHGRSCTNARREIEVASISWTRALGEPLRCQGPYANFFRSRLVLRLETGEDPRKKAACLPRTPDLPSNPEAESID